MIGVVVNAVAIIFGSIVGMVFGNKLNQKYQGVIMTTIGLCVIYIGIDSALEAQSLLILIISGVVGTIIGTAIDLETKLDNLGEVLKKPFKKIANENFVDGFVTATLLFAVGAMAVVGSIEAGMLKKYDILFTKSLMDGITSIVLASSLGLGVAFSSISVGLVEGIIALVAIAATDLFSETLIANISGIGGILILALGLKMLNIKEIPVANMLPAIFIPIIFEIVTKIF